MKHQETEKHDGYNGAQEYSNEEKFVLVLQVLHDDPDVGSIFLSIGRTENLVPQVTFINQKAANIIADVNTIDADESMRKQE